MTHLLHTHVKKPSTMLVLVFAITTFIAAHSASDPSAAGTLTITGVAASQSSVKIYFDRVPGAQDYRAYDVTDPNNVKYAGWTHLTPSPSCPGSSCFHHFVVQADGITPVYPFQVASGASGGPQVLDIPAQQIDWNNVGDGEPHTVVVEALDAIGPVPQGSLYVGTGSDNIPLMSPMPPGAMLGMNKGPTGDGKISTNGQGPYTNTPRVIASSQAFVVQANRNFKAIPSKASATQTFFDTFENAEGSTLQMTYREDAAVNRFGNLGIMKYVMNAGTPRAWEIEYRQANNRDSMPFVSSNHFMDMIFDGSTPGHGPAHTIYGSMAMTPTQSFSISSGRIAHLAWEVDGHQSLRRWLDVQIAPASDPLEGWDSASHQINDTDQALFLEFRDGFCTLDIFTGPRSASDPIPTGSAGGSHGARLWGLAGSTGGAPIMCGWDEMYVKKNFSKNGLGLDDKSRYDFFISQNHAALFQDGQLIIQSDIPAGSFPWANAPLRAYFSHYLYHSDVDILDLQTVQVNGQNMCYQLNSYWFNNPQSGTAPGETVCNKAYPAGYGFRYSDERHWDNMGFEVLAASDAPGSDFSSLASLVQPPAIQVPGAGGFPPTAPTNVHIK